MRAETLENRCFDEIHIGDAASVSRTLTVRDVQLFATVSGDGNPTRLALELVKQFGGTEFSAHSVWLGAQISGLLGKALPGPGTVYAGQDREFHALLAIGEEVTIRITAREKLAQTRRVTFDCQGVNARGETIMSGVARVIALATRTIMDRPDAAQVSIQSHDRFDSFVERCAKLPPVSVAVVHPCARWPTAARSPAPFSMARWRSTTRSARKSRGSRRASRWSPAIRTSGHPDILVVPDLAAGHIHAKQLTFRADNRRAKLDSCAVTCLMASAALVPSPTKTGG